MLKKWLVIDSKSVYKSKFVEVLEETVKLTNGKIISDFNLVKLPDIVMIVAMTKDQRIIILQEYKHGSKEFLYTIPAGHIQDNANIDQIINQAKAELLEETGYSSNNFEFKQILFEYPSKARHKVFVVMATDAYQISNQKLEETETLKYQLIEINNLKKLIKDNLWTHSSSLSALVVSGVLS